MHERSLGRFVQRSESNANVPQMWAHSFIRPSHPRETPKLLTAILRVRPPILFMSLLFGVSPKTRGARARKC